jgi:hypothetical protein
MAQINKPDEYFNTKLYAGNGTDDHAITGVNFQPDLTWIKTRSSGSHYWFDNVRGATKFIKSDSTDAEGTASSTLKSFDTDGFTLGTSGAINSGTENFASWNWLASNTTASNTDGSITSTVSANTTSGFSIVSYSGGGSFGDTVGHGLGSVPAMIIIKTTNATSSWYIWQKNMGATDNQFMDFSTGALQTSGATIFDVSAMSSTTFTLGTNTDVNGSGSPKIAYCFAEKKGFSKFGSYTGNGNADGTFIYTGFKPAFVIVKRTDAVQSWYLLDNKRNTFNPEDKYFKVDASSAEDTLSFFDFVSNGFKARGTGIGFNASGGSYIYMAFAESPLVGTNNIPATAR